MEMSALTRDVAKVHAALQVLDDGAIVAKRPCKIYVPTRFRDKDLMILENEIYIVGIFMLVVDDQYYAVNLTCALMRITPSNINLVILNKVDHFEFIFEKGDTLFPTPDLIKRNKLLYYIFDEIVARANVPVYMDYMDLGHLFDTAKKHANVQLGSTPTILHMLLAVISRNPNKLSQYFRQSTDGKDFDKIEFVPLRSATHGPTNTTARLLGANFGDSLTNALVNPSDREENIERILKM